MADVSLTMADGVVAAIILLSALWGLSRGLVKEVLGVAAWVGAAFVTLHGFAYVRPYARELISIDMVADAGAGIAIFLASLIVFSVASGAIAAQVRGSALGALDRSLGFVFGLARGAVMVCVLYLVVMWGSKPDVPSWIVGARSRPAVERGAEMLMSLIPGAIRDRSADAADQARSDAERAMAAKRALDALTSPPVKPAQPKSEAPDGAKADASKDRTGYNNAERRDLDRLFQGQGQGKQ
jgi:membrane protein required for colicin V production